MGLRPFEDAEDAPQTQAENGGLTPEQVENAEKMLSRFGIKLVLDHALDVLIGLARESIIEERETGKPGPKFAKMLDEITHYTGIPKDKRLERVLVARMLFLLVTAQEMLGRDTLIDPENTEFPPGD